MFKQHRRGFLASAPRAAFAPQCWSGVQPLLPSAGVAFLSLTEVALRNVVDWQGVGLGD